MPELRHEHGMSSATFYKWRAKYGGMDASLMKLMKELEEENLCLKKMYAEEPLKTKIVQNVYFYVLAVCAELRRNGIASALIKHIQPVDIKRGIWLI